MVFGHFQSEWWIIAEEPPSPEPAGCIMTKADVAGRAIQNGVGSVG
jgi:hypothetical protein